MPGHDHGHRAWAVGERTRGGRCGDGVDVERGQRALPVAGLGGEQAEHDVGRRAGRRGRRRAGRASRALRVAMMAAPCRPRVILHRRSRPADAVHRRGEGTPLGECRRIGTGGVRGRLCHVPAGKEPGAQGKHADAAGENDEPPPPEGARAVQAREIIRRVVVISLIFVTISIRQHTESIVDGWRNPG